MLLSAPPACKAYVRALLPLALILGLAACEPVSTTGGLRPATGSGAPLSEREAARNFSAVVSRMEPAIEQECRERTGNRANCDFRIMVDDTETQSPNAYQTLDPQGRPVVAFNLALIAEARNQDELAFVMGHEAAHHIAGHIARGQASATTGALLLGGLAAMAGIDATGIQSAQNVGAGLGGRIYAKSYELEADRLGTIIAWDAGYDPMRGALFFSRLADPGDQFLGSHPPNAERQQLVARTVADLQAGRIR